MSTPTPFAPVSPAHAAVVQSLTALATQDPGAFHEMALRTRSPDALDAVAHLALPGARAQSLLEIGRALTTGLSPADLPAVTPDARWLGELATLCAIQVTDVTPDLLAAYGLWEWASAVGADRMTQRHWDVRAQVSWTLRDQIDSDVLAAVSDWAGQDGRLSEPVAQEVRADLANPWVAGDLSTGSTPDWEQAVAQILGPRLASLKVAAGPGDPFDRLQVPGAEAPLAEASTGGRSVAVIMTAYRPNHQLLTAVRSMIAQTWQEWTLLIIDDASGPDYDDVLAEAVELDERVRLLRQERNGGTYRARNVGLREVGTADFVAFHDSDDWSHPQRLAITLEPLLADPGLVATRAWALKANNSLELTRLGFRGISRSTASLALRRDPVVTTLGAFDVVRKSADKELLRRSSVAFPDRFAEVKDPTVIMRRGQESLSSSDHSRGWRHHSRRHYMQAYQPWHRRIRRGETSADLSTTGERRFWAPTRWLEDSQESPPPVLDVVLAADFSLPDVAEQIDPLIGRARKGGRRVGLLQLDTPVLLTGPEPATSSTVIRRVARGQCEWVYLDDQLEVTQVVVPRVEALHPGADVGSSWTVSQVDLGRPREGVSVDPRLVERRAARTFGGTIGWWDQAQSAWPPLRPTDEGADADSDAPSQAKAPAQATQEPAT